MEKYSEEFKLKVITFCHEQNYGYKYAAKYFSIPSKELVREWLKKYEKYGIDGIKSKKNVQYSGEFKKNVVEYMHKKHLSYAEATSYFNIGNHGTIANWEKIYYEKGPQAFCKEKCGRTKNMNSSRKTNNKTQKIKTQKSKLSNEDLLVENERLKMENAYLKKLQALIQEKAKPKQLKK